MIYFAVILFFLLYSSYAIYLYHTTKTVNAKVVAFLTDKVASHTRFNINSDTVRALNADDRQDEATEHYRW